MGHRGEKAGETVTSVTSSRKRKASAKPLDPATVIVWLGNRDLMGNAVKHEAMSVYSELVRLCGGSAVKGKHGLVITMDAPGDPAWMQENVYAYIDNIGTLSPDQAARRAKAQLERIKELGADPAQVMGWAVVRRGLDKMYMQYDLLEGMRYDIVTKEESG